MAREVPVYLFTGFMDSGKTSLIQETIYENGFAEENDRMLIIACEDGDEEYNEDKLATVRTKVAMIEDEDDFNLATLKALDEKYRPDAVFLEYNGTWEVQPLYEMELPKDWIIVQSLATVDSTTFDTYMLNMRSMMMEQLFRAEVVIFNRCDENTPKAKYRASIKSFNRPAQIVYELKDGSIDNSPEELPFDMNAPVLEITDADYALWFMDVQDNAKKYDGKTVHFKALVYNPPGKLKRDVMVPGRFAMTCCVEDIQFLGLKCKTRDAAKYAHKSWIDITATVKNEFATEYRGKGPVLYPTKIEPAEAPATQEEGLVYFS